MKLSEVKKQKGKILEVKKQEGNNLKTGRNNSES